MNVTPITAIVPMRHSSERVRGKNFRPFAGRPLYHYIVETLRACPEIGKVVIDTDSPFILEEAPRLFPGVVALERPAHLRAGEIAMNDVLLNTIASLEGSYFLQTHSTNPLLRPETVSRAIRAFFESQPAHDSLFAVTRLQTRIWRKDGSAVNHDPAVLLRTQDLPPVYEENSNLYIFSRELLASRRNRIGVRPLLFETERAEAIDIDEEIDFFIAECLYKHRQGGSAQ